MRLKIAVSPVRFRPQPPRSETPGPPGVFHFHPLEKRIPPPGPPPREGRGSTRGLSFPPPNASADSRQDSRQGVSSVRVLREWIRARVEPRPPGTRGTRGHGWSHAAGGGVLASTATRPADPGTTGLLSGIVSRELPPRASLPVPCGAVSSAKSVDLAEATRMMTATQSFSAE